MRIVNGFGTYNQKNSKEVIKVISKEATVNDYIKFGLLPELVGRTPIRTFVNRLSKMTSFVLWKIQKIPLLLSIKLSFNFLISNWK